VEPREQFAANLRRLRGEAELTQERLGALASMHPTEISRLERAVRDPQLSTLVRIARALGVSPCDLLAEVE
jgi:transcriptional regulator with XRE-family HTH domain